jgi:hypothetical protein
VKNSVHPGRETGSIWPCLKQILLHRNLRYKKVCIPGTYKSGKDSDLAVSETDTVTSKFEV